MRRFLLYLVLFLFLPTCFAGQFTYSAKKRVFKVCNLLMDSAPYNPSDPNSPPENSDPYVFYVLDSREDLKPYGWELINPLAPATVSPEIAYRWNYRDRRDPQNPYYVGQPVKKNMACYWEVLLSEVSVEDLLQFDLVFITNHRFTTFTPQDLEKLRRFVDAGGHLWIDDCSGFRIADANFITPLQFTNEGPRGVAIVADPYHPLLSYPFQLTYQEISQLGDKNINNYFISVYDPAVLQPVVLNYHSSRPDRPYIAAGQYGAGLIIATSGDVGCDINDPCGGRSTSSGQNSGAYAGEYIQNAHSEDIKLVWNMILWANSWSSFRKDSRQSALSYEEIKPPLDAKWEFSGDTFGIYSPVVWNGIVVTVSNNGVVYAFDADPYRDIDNDGNPDDGVANPFNPTLPYDLLWSYNTGATPVSGASLSPLVTSIWLGPPGETVEVVIAPVGNRLVCLPLYPPNPNVLAPIWQRALPGAITTSPVLVRGAIFVGSGNMLYALRTTDGFDLGAPIALGSFTAFTTAPSVAGQANNRNHERIAIGGSTATGSGIQYLEWNWARGRFEMRGIVALDSAPLSAIIFTPDDNLICTTAGGWIYKIPWGSARPAWRYYAGRPMFYPPAVSYKQGMIYAVAPDGGVYALELNPTFRIRLHYPVAEGSIPFVRYASTADADVQTIANALGINIDVPPLGAPPRYDFNPQTGEITFTEGLAMSARDVSPQYLLRVEYYDVQRNRRVEHWLLSDTYPVQQGGAWYNGYAISPNLYCFVLPTNLVWRRNTDLDGAPLVPNCAPVVLDEVVYVGASLKLVALQGDPRTAKLGDRISILDIQSGSLYDTTNSYLFNEEALSTPPPNPPVYLVQKPFPGGILFSQSMGLIANLAGASKTLLLTFFQGWLLALHEPTYLIADNGGILEGNVDFDKVDSVGRVAGKLSWSIDSVIWRSPDGQSVTQPLTYPQVVRQLGANSFLVVDTGSNRILITDRGGVVQWQVGDLSWAGFGNPNQAIGSWESSSLGQPSDAWRWAFTLPDPQNPNASLTRYFTLIADPGNFRIVSLVEEWNPSARQWTNRSIVWATRTQREGRKYIFTKIIPVETINDPAHPQAGAIWRFWTVVANYRLTLEWRNNQRELAKEEPGVSLVMINRAYEAEPGLGIVYAFSKVQRPNGDICRITAVNSLVQIMTDNVNGVYDLLISGIISPEDTTKPPVVGVFRLLLPNQVFDPASPFVGSDVALPVAWEYIADDWLLTNPQGRHPLSAVDARHFFPVDAKQMASGEYLIALANPSASEVIMVNPLNNRMLWAVVEMAEPQEKQRVTGFETIRVYHRLKQPVFVDTLKGGSM